MEIEKVTATKCYIKNASQSEIDSLKKDLTFTNTSVAFNIKSLKENRWLQKNRPHTYNQRLAELQPQLKTCLLKSDSYGYWFNPGSIPYLDKDYDFEILNEITYPKTRKVPWKKPLPFDLYPYQALSAEALIEAKHGCVELCTGAGKTAIILTLARELGSNTVIVTPSKSIFLEIYKKFKHHFGTSQVGAYGAGKKIIGRRFTVCVSKSLTLLEEGTEAYGFFANANVVIGDESHTLAAETLESVFHGVLKNVPYRFFLSGTQVRGDGKDRLLEAIIGKKVHSLTTKEAVDGGYICPVKFTVIETTSKNTRKYKNPLEVKRKQFLRNENIADIAAKIANSAWNVKQESTLILVDELEQIQMLASRLDVPFGYAHSADKKKSEEFGITKVKPEESVEAFNRGEIKVLIGTSCIATGTNLYSTHHVINWVGGSSEVRTKQGAIGRSVRLLEKSEFKEFHKPKPVSNIYDFRVSNIPLMENHLQKRLAMYRETSDDIRFLKLC